MAENGDGKDANVRIAKISAAQAIAVAIISAIAAGVPVYLATRQQGSGSTTIEPVQIDGTTTAASESKRAVDFLLRKTESLSKTIDEYQKQLRLPPKERIILCEHINYKGHCYGLEPGDNAAQDLRLFGFGKAVSSVKIEGSLKARAYPEINYSSAPSLLIESNIPSLYDHDWNDKMLSIDIDKR